MAFVADMEMVAYDLKTAVFAEFPWTVLNIENSTVAFDLKIVVFAEFLRAILSIEELTVTLDFDLKDVQCWIKD